jgi:uncharacterized protein (DUF433 family)
MPADRASVEEVVQSFQHLSQAGAKKGKKMSEAQIVSDPNIAFGKPTIAGTRIAVELIIEELGAGMTIEDIMEQHALTREQVQAALSYTIELLAQIQATTSSTQATA